MTRLHVEMEHAVGQRGAHVVADGAVEAGIAGGHHHPAVGQPVVADLAVQDQRIGRDLQPLVGRGQLVEEQDAGRLFCRGQELRRKPHRLGLHLVGIDGAADVHRLDGRQPQVDQRHAEVLGHLTHHRGLAHAARTPQHGGAAAQHCFSVLLDQRRLGGGNRHRRDVHRVGEHVSVRSGLGYRAAPAPPGTASRAGRGGVAAAGSPGAASRASRRSTPAAAAAN